MQIMRFFCCPVYLVSTAATASISAIYAPVICIHCPPPPHLWRWAGIMGFHFPESCYKPALWGNADDNNPALCPALHNRKSQQGKCPNVKPPHFPGTAGTIKIGYRPPSPPQGEFCTL